jgi:uncharacterized membrane protein YphA (DoxX/SURF4 family)
MEPSRTVADWSPGRRFLFRLLFSYLVLYIFPFPLDVIPYGPVLTKPYQDLWNAIVPWVGKRLFHVAITVRPNGSGDTTYNYVQVLCYLVLALAAACVWTLLDRRRTEYARLSDWLRVYVRFALGTAMLLYGASKVIQSQFPAPSIDILLEPFGQESPMGLLWNFMGASTAYNAFTGFAEMLGGVLLISRRTTLLGALVCIGVTSNVFLLNMSYDVPVKLYSGHLLAMAIFLAFPDLRRLADLFLLNRPVPPGEIRPLFRRPRLHRGTLVLRTTLVLAFAAYSLYGSYQTTLQYGALAPKPPLYGIWNVEALKVDGQASPPLLTDAARWRRVIFPYPQLFMIQRMDETNEYYQMSLNQPTKKIGLKKYKDPKWRSFFTYQQSAPDLLLLTGTFDGKKIEAKLRRFDERKFPLLSRGFHWINEYPYNR